MLKKILGVLLSLLVLITIIIAMAPAKTVIPFILEKLPQRFQAIQFQQVEGSVWAPKISSIQYQQHKIENVSLDIKPLNLIVGNMALDVVVSDSNLTLDGALIADQNEIKVKDLNYKLNADRLSPFMEFPVKGLDGNLRGLINKAIFNNDGSWKNLTGKGEWMDAKVYYLNSQLVLGDINYELSTNENYDIALEIINNQGPLDLKGNLTISPDKKYQLNFTMSEQLPEEIGTWISRIGKIENDRYRVVWKGKIK